jgi:hypothetical protein
VRRRGVHARNQRQQKQPCKPLDELPHNAEPPD